MSFAHFDEIDELCREYDKEGSFDHLFLNPIHEVDERITANTSGKNYSKRYDLIYSLNLDGIFISVDMRSDMLIGYKPNELLNLPFTQIVALQDSDLVRKEILKVMKGKQSHYKAHLKHKKGHYIAMRMKNIPIVTKNKTVGIYGLAEEIIPYIHEKRLRTYDKEITGIGSY